MKACFGFSRSLLLLASMLLVADCSGQNSTGPTSSAGSPALQAPALDATATSDYRISPRDILEVAVFQVPDLTRTVQVNGAGEVTLPLLGNVQISGRTIDQAQQEIAAKLRKSYLRSPQVIISLKQSGQRVTFNGAVSRRDVLTIEGRLTLSQAIAKSGGLNELANSERIHVARVGDGERVNDTIHNLDAIHKGDEPDPVLQGGDIVVVEDSNTKLALKNLKDILPFAGIAAFLASDIRLKQDIVPVAWLSNGLRLYRYRYKWSDTVYVGVIAQEVLKVAPNAVVRGSDGYLRVDYAQLGLRLQTWDEWSSRHGGDFYRQNVSYP
jgi:polysaccharide export outer membrane protein